MARPEYVNIRLEPELKEQFQRACEKNYTNMTQVIKDYCVKYVRENEKEATTMTKKDFTHTCLQELTGRESGIIVYGPNQGILLNWAALDGIPRLFATGLVGSPEEIPDVKGCKINNLHQIIANIDLDILADYTDDEFPETAVTYQVADDVLVITPDGWC